MRLEEVVQQGEQHRVVVGHDKEVHRLQGGAGLEVAEGVAHVAVLAAVGDVHLWEEEAEGDWSEDLPLCLNKVGHLYLHQRWREVSCIVVLEIFTCLPMLVVVGKGDWLHVSVVGKGDSMFTCASGKGRLEITCTGVSVRKGE